MAIHVLVPGIFGTELVDRLGRTIWPPGLTPGQPISSGELVNIIAAETTTIGQVIKRAQCAGQVYGPVLDHLGHRPGRVAPFAYDWRIDIRAAAGNLAQHLAALPADQPIVLVGHSMGGLVVRWLLECGEHGQKPWFDRIALAVLVCAPHFGAALAVFRILGIAGIPVILPPWAFRALADNPREYPSGYQLLPAPHHDCVSRPGDTSLDIFEAFPGLNRTGLAAAHEVHDVLDRFARPAHIPYRVAYGIGQGDTVVGIRLEGGMMTEVLGDGDGTVPSWSGDPTASSAPAKVEISDVKSFVGDHVGIMSNQRFLAQLDLWLSEVTPLA